MVTLDSIKILTDKKHIRSLDPNVTDIILKNNISMARRYSQKKPFKIYMNYSLLNNECLIEFSSKLLLDRYPELINKNNIYDCFKNIENIGICKIDIEGAVQDSELLTCDITKDFSGIAQPDRLAMKSCLRNLNKYRVQKYGYSGNEVIKMVKTSSRKNRLIIYDKGKELRKKTNTDFLGMVNDSDALIEYFDGKFRVEANIKTQKQIRQLFQTDTTNLIDVLNSKENPLLTIFDDFFSFPEEPDQKNQKMLSPLSYPKLKMVKNALFLEACKYDMEKVDLILNNTLSPNTDKSKYRAELNNLLNSYPQPNKNIQVMKKVRELIDNSVK